MESIFNDASFGALYKTRDGRKVVFIGREEKMREYPNKVLVEGEDHIQYVNPMGELFTGEECSKDVKCI